MDIITESLIKGIIVSYSRTGITTSQIANVFYECTGENWPLKGSQEHAISYLEQIEGVLWIVNEKNELLWYVRGKTLQNGENRGQIYRAANAHGNLPNTCSRNNNNNDNHCRNARNNNTNWSKNKVDRNNNRRHADINGNYDPRNGKLPTNNRRANGRSSGSDHSDDSGVASGITSSTEHKTSASLYNFDLVGDDFFLEMAKIDLGCNFTNRKQIHRSGLCVSGQSIRDACERIKRYPHPDNMKIIANLGTVDILHGRDLADMYQDYYNLVKVCNTRGIEIVITTLPPIANRLHLRSDVQKLNDFNDFLLKLKNQLVIDIRSCMTCPATGKVLFDCYQGHPKFMSGTNQPHLLWNRIGRQRVLKAIKAKLRF